MTASPLKNLIDRVPYKPYIRPLSPLAIVHQYLSLVCLAASILAMPIIAYFNKNLLFVFGTFTNTSETRQFALGSTLLALELLTAYLVIGMSLSYHPRQQ